MFRCLLCATTSMLDFLLAMTFQSFCLSQSIPVMDFQHLSCKSWVSVLVLDIKVLVLVLVLELLCLGLGLGLGTAESWSWSWSWNCWVLVLVLVLDKQVLVLILVLDTRVLNPSLLITNRKSHMSFRLVPKSVTLNDLERRNRPMLNFTEFGSFLGGLRKSGWRYTDTFCGKSVDQRMYNISFMTILAGITPARALKWGTLLSLAKIWWIISHNLETYVLDRK